MMPKKSPIVIHHGKVNRRAMLDALIKLNPLKQVRNPVMFVVEVGSLLTTMLWIQALTGEGEAPAGFIGTIALWLWFTVLFANFSEALAEGRGKAQAESLRESTPGYTRQNPSSHNRFPGISETHIRTGFFHPIEKE
jgi:K+-transporting ATPase ATPase B chain